MIATTFVGLSKFVMKMNILLTFLALAVATAVADPEYSPIVHLNSGKVRGLVVSVDSHKVFLYQGIRYGQAKRFSLAQPVGPWSDVYDATRPRFACPQADYTVSEQLPSSDPNGTKIETKVCNEDCLYLNVWQPEKASSNRSVMMWIHGGGFYEGTIFSRQFDSRYLSAAGDVIVVTINYRLGALGFLYGGEASDEAPGNMGLRDQIFALQWIRDNIHHFGGNPNDVTIFGESAGAMSVGALVLSPLAKNLFHRAILQSGAPNSFRGGEHKQSSLPKLATLAHKLNCSQSTHHLILECLRNKTVPELLEADQISLESFVQIYGDKVLPISPAEALKTSKFNQNVDLMFGVTSGEAVGLLISFIPQLYSDDLMLTLDLTNEIIGSMFRELFHRSSYQEEADFYTRHLTDESSQEDFRRAVSDSFGDFNLVCPTVLFGQQMAQVNPVKRRYYSYRLTHAPAGGCYRWGGVCHEEDTVFMFGQPMLKQQNNNQTFTEQDHKLAVDMVRAWTQFAKTGSPGPMDGEHLWEEALRNKSSSVQFMQLDPADYKMVADFYKGNCDAFWKVKIL